MDAGFHTAAKSGLGDAIKGLLFRHSGEHASNGSTDLHRLAQFSCDAPESAVKEILSLDEGMILERNGQGQTPLVIASRNGHAEIVRALINCAKASEDGSSRLTEMLEVVDRFGNSALHEAVTNNQPTVVQLLLDGAPEGFSFGPNFAGETPLYLAVEKGNLEIVKLIFSKCKSPPYHGPEGNTILHAAAATNSPECIELILEKMPSVAKEVNKIGWTALHNAAINNHLQMVDALLKQDKSMGYVKTEDGSSNTALHIAASHGHVDVMKKILSHCPDSWDMYTRRRKNVLHLAVENGHLAMDRELPVKEELIIAGNTPELRRVNEKAKFDEIFEGGKDVVETILLVATLIITVTFAAGFAVPGGYVNTKGGREGMSVLSKKTSLTAFVISDSLALMFAVTTVFLLISIRDYEKSIWKILVSKIFVASAIQSLFVAFVAAVHAVIPVRSVRIYIIVLMTVIDLPIFLYGLGLFLSLPP